jgi:hypothetical protein
VITIKWLDGWMVHFGVQVNSSPFEGECLVANCTVQHSVMSWTVCGQCLVANCTVQHSVMSWAVCGQCLVANCTVQHSVICNSFGPHI